MHRHRKNIHNINKISLHPGICLEAPKSRIQEVTPEKLSRDEEGAIEFAIAVEGTVNMDLTQWAPYHLDVD